MSLLLLFAYTPLAPSVPISELVQTAPLPGVGYAIQRPATSGEWRFGLELADPTAGDLIVWHDITQHYAGDVYQRGADDYLGKYRAAVAQVQLQTDNDDLAPWGQDTTDVFGVNVELDGGLLMRATVFRVVASVTVEWAPIWTGRVETWGDASAARGQIRTHVVTVVDTIADLANVPTAIEGNNVPWQDWLDENLNDANWLFGRDFYGDEDGMGLDSTPTAAIVRMDQATDVFGLVWRSRRNGRLIVHPAPWNTTSVERWDNPLLDVYPSGLVFNYSPDFTDIAYIADDDQQPFGIQRTSLGVLNSFLITYSDDFDNPQLYADDDAVSMSRYGVRPFTASWTLGSFDTAVVDDLKAARAYSSSQALPLRTTLDHEGFWSAMSLIDQYDPVTIIHATSETGLVVTGTGTVRNVTERRTVRGEGTDTKLISWESTVQVDIESDETSPALLPVEDLAWVSSSSGGSEGAASAVFTWTNPTQPNITPTEVQLRVLGQSLIWSSESYPGVGADGTTINWLDAGRWYTLQVRLIRRVNGVITAQSAIRSVRFPTPNRIFPIPVPGDDPTDTNVDMPPFDDCQDDVSIELQENDGLTVPYEDGWTTVDTFDGAEIEQDANGVWHLVDDIPNSFFNAGSMYRFLGFCGTQLIVTGLPFDPPDDWTDPCPTPAALSDPPFNDPSLLVYVPKVCTGFEDADPDYLFQGMLIIEAVSGIAGVPGAALDNVVSIGGDPAAALLALPDPAWSDAAAGILAYGECPQIIGATGDKTMMVRVMIADVKDCVLFECAGMQILCTAVSGTTWRATAVVYKVGDTTITLPSTALLDIDTEYTIAVTSELATGNILLYIDETVDNSVGGSDNVATITALPIWRVGAPPGSWITDCGLFDSVLTFGLSLADTILAHGAHLYGYWKLDDAGTTMIDSSSGGHNGTASGAGFNDQGQAGPLGNYARFGEGGSSSRVAISSFTNADPDVTIGMVVFAIVYPDTSPPARTFIISHGNTADFAWNMDDGNASATAALSASSFTSAGNTVAGKYSAANVLVSGQWQAVAASWPTREDGPTVFYRNGVALTMSTITPTGSPAAISSANVNIGWRADSPAGQHFDGAIAHVAIFRGGEDITDVFNAAQAEGWF